MPREQAPNFLDHVPCRSAGSSVGDDGRTVVLVPKFGRGMTGRAADRLLGSRAYVKLHLDELGTATWDLIDGMRTVSEIAETVFPDAAARNGDGYVRTSKFLGMLARIGAISVRPPDSSGTAGGRR